jgi:hypothetical protein
VGIQRRHKACDGNALGLSDALVVREEKCTVLDNRSADRAAKLIPLERCFRDASRILKEIRGIQCAIAQKLITASMECISSRTRNGVDYSTRSLSVLSRIIAGEDRKFLNGVHAQISTENAARRPIGVVI